MIDKAIGIFIIVVIGIGLLFWAFNNPNGLGSSVDSGASKVHSKVATFDYSGGTAPGAGHTAP
ncbi:hypothetical protein I8J29_16540 [Paenibacillus sp. MWE-103]|uniref:Uncharacterized protein n=1 Tax=Paenibacillus artemisiicola TaxID=1172618 RepID=A0ABS3WBY7_9BACL|nr:MULTISPECIES: hypothetical protein [Paenibacillus]MBO7745818.1 hypothetical protein [Paenibacillus artemisiicola]